MTSGGLLKPAAASFKKKKKKSLTLSVNMKRSGVVGNEVRDFGKSQWFAVSPAPLCGGEAGVGGSPPLKP